MQLLGLSLGWVAEPCGKLRSWRALLEGVVWRRMRSVRLPHRVWAAGGAMAGVRSEDT